MTAQKKLPSDIEENIQNLAGDIYLQIEDKITALLNSYSENIEVTPEIITTHPLFIALQEQEQSHQKQASQNHEGYNVELTALQAEKVNQQAKLAQLQESLTNAENHNSATLTDLEQILKAKLDENLQLAKQVSTLNEANAQQQQLLKEMALETEKTTKQLKLLATEKDAIAKNDKAKAATLADQNQQHSGLQLKLDQMSSELEYLKAEQEHKLLSSHEQLSHEQEQAGQLSEQISALQKELKTKQVALDQQQEAISKTEHENNDLTTKVTRLEQNIVQIEQNGIVAQQQYEKDKQQVNDKWLNEQEKNAQILKQASDDNEQIIKQMHDAERNKQALENQLFSVNDELTAINKQQQQALDSIKILEAQVDKEKAATAELREEKKLLAASLLQAEQGHSKNYEQQVQKVTELTQTLAKTVVEGKNTQQTIANLEQKSQTQALEITSLARQVETVQLESKQAIDKQNENYQQVVIEHQQVLADKNAALTELQQQADKTTIELSQQLDTKTALLETQSTTLSQLQLSYNKAMANIDKIEQDLSENQQQLTVVQTALAADKATTAKKGLWHQETKDKQEVEYNKARETIKYLRDENTELNRKLVQQVNDLEDKLTEYRLRFEYAQKQIMKLSK